LARFSKQVERDFERARFKAFVRDLFAQLRRRPSDRELLSFEAVRRALKAQSSFASGRQTVPVDKIIGSATNRYHDFDRAFLPAQSFTRARWQAVDQAKLDGVELPPVLLYQLGDYYFVRDGHHRISVARQTGQEFVDADVVQVRTRVPLTGDETELDRRNLEVIGEYADFIERTHLDKILPEVEIHFSEPGGYERLIEHITVHRYFRGIDKKRDVSWDEAVKSWHRKFYEPIANLIRARDILKSFPGRTEADLYLWIMDHYHYLRQRSGKIDLAFAAEHFASHYSTRLSRRFAHGVQHALQDLRHLGRRDNDPSKTT
jgi:hypothetical protein